MSVNSSNENNQKSYSDFYKSDFLKRFREVNPAYGLNNEDVNTDEKLWDYLLKMKPSLEDAQFKNDILPDRSQGSIEATNIYLNEFSKDSTNNEKPSIYEMISGPMQESINESVFKETAKIEQIEQKEADEKVDIQNMMDRRASLVNRKEPIVKVEGIKNHLGGPVSVAKPLASKISTASEALAEKGIRLDIMDSTVREQDKLKSYLEYVEGGRKGPKKSHPDTSFHTIGYAVDLANTPEMKNEEVFDALKSVGLTQHEDEWWHFSFDPQEEKEVEGKQPTFAEREDILKVKEHVPHVYDNSSVRRHAQGLYSDFEKRLMSEFDRDIMKDVSKQAGVESLPELNRVQHFIGYTIDNSFMGEAVKWMLTPLTGDPKEYWMYQYWGQTKSAKEYAENMNTLEQIGSAVLGFLLPLDKLAFLKGGKFAHSGLAVAKKRLVKMLTDRGLPLGVANQVANSSKHHLWERMARTGGAIATHGTATSVMRDMNYYMGAPEDTRPEKWDSAKKYVSEFTKSFIVGGTASFAGHHAGKIDHAGLQAAMRGHGGKIADFVAEVLVFSTIGTAIHDPSGVAKAYEQEELMDMWWKSFVHTAGLMLALKYIHSLEDSDYPTKVKLKKGDGVKLQEQLKSEIDLENETPESLRKKINKILKENGVDGEMETSEAAESLLKTSQDTKAGVERMKKEVQDVVDSVRESPKQKKKRVKEESKAQKKLNEDQALVEIKDAISRGEYRKASRLAVDITAEGKDIKPMLEQARSELLTETEKSNLSRSEKKNTRRFINVATNGAKNFGRMKQKYGDKRRNIRLEESLEKKLDEFNLTLGKKKRWGAKEETRTSAIEPSEPAPTASLNSVKKSKDLSSTSRKNIKPFKGEGYDGKSKKFKSKEEAQRAANDILSKNIPRNLLFNYFQAKDGSVIMRVFENVSKKGQKQKYPIQDTQTEGMSTVNPKKVPLDTNSAKKEIETDPIGSNKSVNPETKMGASQRKIAYENEISKLERTLEAQRTELARIREKALKDSLSVKSEKAKDKMRSNNMDADRLQTSIKATEELIHQSKKRLIKLMETKDLQDQLKEYAKNRSKDIDWQKGAIYIGGKKGKNKSIERQREDEMFLESLREFYRRAEAHTKDKVNNFIDYLARKGLEGDGVARYVEKNFHELEKQVGIENTLEILKLSDHTRLSHRYEFDAVPPVSSNPDDPNKVGSIDVSKYGKDKREVVRNVYNNIGRHWDLENIRLWKKGVKPSKIQLEKRSRLIARKKEVFEMIMKKNTGSLNFDDHIVLLQDNLATSLEYLHKNIDNPAAFENVAIHVEWVAKLRSAWGRAGKKMQDPANVNPKVLQELLHLDDFKLKGVKSAELLRILEKIYARGETSATPDRSLWWIGAEVARNVKLFSFSSLFKGIVGNGTMSMMEMLSVQARPAFARLFSLEGGRTSGISKFEAWDKSLGAQTKAYKVYSLRDALFNKETGGFKIAWELLKENDSYMKQNPYLENEAYGRDFPTLLGKFVRIPQNMQGAMDAPYRNAWMQWWLRKLILREATKEFRREGIDINKNPKRLFERADQIMTEMSPDVGAYKHLLTGAKAKAREMVYQKELGSWAKTFNKMRTNKEWHGALGNTAVPFMATHLNVFKKMIEFSPLGFLHPAISKVHMDAMLRPFYGNKKSVADPDMAAEYASRALVGTAMFAITGHIVNNILDGKVQGSWASLDKEERDLLRGLNYSEYGFQLEDGTNLDIRGIDPISMYIQSMVEYVQEPDERRLVKIYASATSLGNYLTNSPVAMLASDWSQLVKDEDSWGRIAGRFITAMWQPTITRQISRLKDPTRYKEIRDGDVSTDGYYYTTSVFKDDHEKGAFGENMQVYSKKDLKYWKETRWPALDIFGMPIITEVGKGIFVGVRRSDLTDKTNPEKARVYKEYLRLFGESQGNFNIIKIKPFATSIKRGNTTIKLSHEEQHHLNRIAGVSFYQVMESFLDKPVYRKKADNDKREFWRAVRDGDKTYKYTNDAGRTENAPSIKAFIESVMFRDLIGLAKTIEMLNDPIVTQESGARKRLKMIAPNISQEDLDDVVLNAKNMNKKKGAMERAISIMRKNMPWEDRDFVDERDLVLKTLQSEGGLLNPQAVDLYPEKIQTEGLRQ